MMAVVVKKKKKKRKRRGEGGSKSRSEEREGTEENTQGRQDAQQRKARVLELGFDAAVVDSTTLE